MLRVAKRLRSTMLVANAWHARSDAASSLVVSVGVMANLAGLPLGDPLAASVVGLMILRMGWKFSIGAFHDLTDKAVDQETEERIAKLLRETPGVEGIHQLRNAGLRIEGAAHETERADRVALEHPLTHSSTSSAGSARRLYSLDMLRP